MGKRVKALILKMIALIFSSIITVIINKTFDDETLLKITSFLNKEFKLWIILLIGFILWIVWDFINIIKNKSKQENKFNDYIPFLIEISEELCLNNWTSFSTEFSNRIVSLLYINNRKNTNQILHGTLWTGKKKIIEIKIKRLLRSYDFLISRYLKHAVPSPSGNSFSEDQFYKSIYPNPSYDSDLELFKVWQKEVSMSFYNYVFELNELIKYLNKKKVNEIVLLRNLYFIEDVMPFSSMSSVEEMRLPKKRIKKKRFS